jgi:hypothetical protein
LKGVTPLEVNEPPVVASHLLSYDVRKLPAEFRQSDIIGRVEALGCARTIGLPGQIGLLCVWQ